MPVLFTLAFLAVLVMLTVMAVRTWLAARGRTMEPAERAVFVRFVAGIALFWLVAIAGYAGGYMRF
jgi:hypothetical protein